MQDFTATVITLVLVHRCRSTYQSCTIWGTCTQSWIYWLLMLGSMIRLARHLAPITGTEHVCYPPGDGVKNSFLWFRPDALWASKCVSPASDLCDSSTSPQMREQPSPRLRQQIFACELSSVASCSSDGHKVVSPSQRLDGKFLYLAKCKSLNKSM